MPRVVVAGSINMDVVATADRLPRMGETVFGSKLGFFPGGKGANQAVAAERQSSETLLIGRTGDDSFGADALEFLAREGINLNHVKKIEATPTGTALIIVVSGDNSIVVIPGANMSVTPEVVAEVPIQPKDVLLSQFEIPRQSVERFFSNGKQRGGYTILNAAPAAPVSRAVLEVVDLLVVNETELEVISGGKLGDPTNVGEIERLVAQLRAPPNLAVVVTLGAHGAVGFSRGETFRVQGRKVDVVDTTGAGDCFVGSMGSEIARGASLVDAIKYANVAASICVQRPGAGPSMPRRSEVTSVLASGFLT